MHGGSGPAGIITSMRTVRWGILGVSKFAMSKVVPAMKNCLIAKVEAIASRDLARAEDAADAAGIPKAYDSYEAMLADPELDVIYNPLPNHLHVPWSVRAADARKHVLCEKPIALRASELDELIAARDRNEVHIAEAFMIRTHPQWLTVVEKIRGGAIGELRSVQIAFSYFNRDGNNIRNRPDVGGGALYDIGCYGVNVSRLVFGAEPRRVISLFDRDPEFGVDRLFSAILDFEKGQASFVCGTQQVPYQRVQIFGTTGRIEIEIPFNAIPNERMRFRVDDGKDLHGKNAQVEEVPACDQYTIQADVFSRAVLGEGKVAVSLEDARNNMAVIDGLFRSGESNRWESVGR